MVWCSNCAKNISHPDHVDGRICCNLCGRVLEEDNFSSEPTFTKNAAGQSQLSGTNVKNQQSTASHERTLREAYDGISSMMYALDIDGGHPIADAAKNLYGVASDKQFTKGRRRELVQAACLYIVCRDKEKPYLLIDFSEYLRVNVHLGGMRPVISQKTWQSLANRIGSPASTMLGEDKLCQMQIRDCELGLMEVRSFELSKLLSLQEHPKFQKPMDPSLFLHRFTNCLFNGKANDDVTKTAILIIKSMKRDWMQTGRKPSGLCGAAVYISALSHGFKCSKSEIIRVVHVCEATLTKRLIEFESTESGGLTIEEFEQKALEFGTGPDKFSNLVCEHKDSDEPPFAHGLCKLCYDKFIKLIGGLNGGSEPPAFQSAEKKQLMMMEAATADSSENLDFSTLPNLGSNSKLLNSDDQRSIKNISEYKATQPADTDTAGATLQSEVTYDSSDGKIPADVPSEDSESLSDIDDSEVDIYLLSEEGAKLKKIVWEEMNKEYLEEQAVKEAAEIAAKKAYEASFSNCSEDVKAAQKLAAAAAEAVAKSKKEKQQKRAAENKNAAPPQSAAEAAKRILDKKRLSSKINIDMLDKLFEDEDNPETIKKMRIEPKSDRDDKNYINNSKEDDETEFEGNEDPYIDNMEEENMEVYDDDYDHDDL